MSVGIPRSADLGETDPENLVELAHPRLKAGRAALAESPRGRVTPHHRFLFRLHLDRIDALNKAVRDLEARMGESLASFRGQVEHLKTIPGVSDTVAQTGREAQRQRDVQGRARSRRPAACATAGRPGGHLHELAAHGHPGEPPGVPDEEIGSELSKNLQVVAARSAASPVAAKVCRWRASPRRDTRRSRPASRSCTAGHIPAT